MLHLRVLRRTCRIRNRLEYSDALDMQLYTIAGAQSSTHPDTQTGLIKTSIVINLLLRRLEMSPRKLSTSPRQAGP